MTLNVQFWARPPAAAPVRLASVKGWEFARVAGQVGAIKLEYPTNGVHFDVLRSMVDNGTDLALDVRIDGTAATAFGGLLLDAEGDDVKPGALWTFTGAFNECLMLDFQVAPSGDAAANNETTLAGTPGLVLATLMADAHDRGTDHVTYASFTDTHDSNGVPWPSTTTVKSSPGRSYYDILTTLEQYGHVEWEVTRLRELRLYVPGTRGVDRTTGSSPVTLRWGRDLGDAPRKYTIREAATTLTAAGKDGIYAIKSNAAAVLRRGRQIERYASFGSAADQGVLDTITQRQIDLSSAGLMQVSHALALHPDAPTPLIDYRERDTVLSVTSAGAQALVVQQLTVRGDDKGVQSAAAALGTLIEGRRLRTQQQIDALASGELVAGTSTPAPETDDGKAPKAPGVITVDSAAGYDAEGHAIAVVVASWAPVNRNADETVAFDIAGYEVQARYADGGTLPVEWVTYGLTSTPSLSWSPMAVAQVVRVRVRCYDKYGHLSDWSAEVAITTASDADAPPVPSTPIVSPYLGLLSVEWNGVGSASEPMPSDFREVEIHTSTSAAFAVDRPADMSLSTTYVASLNGPGIFPVALGSDQDGITWYFRLVSVDNNGNASDASSAAGAAPGLIEDGDVRELNVGKLRTGILTALMTVSGLIRTALSGGRVEISNSGLRLFRPSGVLSMLLDATTGDVALYKPDGVTASLKMTASTGIVEMLGKLTAGAAAATGARIIIDPNVVPNPGIFFHTGTSAPARPAFMNGFVPGFGSNTDVGLGINGGPTSGGVASRVTLLRDSGIMDVVNASTQSLRGGEVVVDDTGTHLRAYNNSGTEQAALDIQDDGSISTSKPIGTLGAGQSLIAQGGNAGGYRTYTGGGSYLAFVENQSNQIVNLGGPSGAYKTFVIPHPVDPDRWLVHACTEAPAATVEYRGVAHVVNHAADVELPSYFEAATTDERHVQVTVVLPDERLDRPAVEGEQPLYGPARPGEVMPAPEPGRPPIAEHELLPRAAASTPRDGRFRITCDGPDGTLVAWHVQATRADAPTFDVEPLRSDVDAHGDGPYRYLTPKGAA